MDFHADDVFGWRLDPVDIPRLLLVLAKKTPWTYDERQLVNMALRDIEYTLGRPWLVAQDFAINNLL